MKEYFLKRNLSIIKRSYTFFTFVKRFSKPSLQEITVSGVIDASDLEAVLHTVSLLTQHEFKLEGDTCTII
mgnify:CR=1 FL=1